MNPLTNSQTLEKVLTAMGTLCEWGFKWTCNTEEDSMAKDSVVIVALLTTMISLTYTGALHKTWVVHHNRFCMCKASHYTTSFNEMAISLASDG